MKNYFCVDEWSRGQTFAVTVEYPDKIQGQLVG